MENKESGARIQSVSRAAGILKCFSSCHELGVTEIAEMVGLHKSTAFGIISTLVHCGFLQQDPVSGKYSIGVELFRLGQLYDRDLGRLVRPYLESLVSEFQETANYVVPNGSEIVYIEKIESPHSMRIRTARGQSLPMYCTGAGKALLAHLPRKEREEVLNRTELKPFTDRTITDRDTLEKELMKIRRDGYAVDDEEMEFGLFCIAAPVLDRDGTPLGAISVSGPTIRMSETMQQEISSRLIQYSEKISALHSDIVRDP